MTVRDIILAAIATRLAGLADEIEIEPAGDPTADTSLGVTMAGDHVIEREAALTRRVMTVTVDGFVVGEGGAAPTAARLALHAGVVAELMADETLGGTAELIDDADLRLFTATLSSERRLAFAQDFDIQFTTSRRDPALPA
ncbi:hypothetical protein COA17_11065 [Sphingomonas ginsenosidimutans]|jgi:hypothetical protein|uniref:DUF3168 domain-containing protein n=1 Tax=Sphingomonas ginsenosidimutans TaxID=862134 RepID=A0A2A4HXQ6_9SPHN|nr:hypothetical protein [Sphingomonas ginsenosidimutans]PCG08689.1 hypothetical protein COA17_11065 [Sphingomonas ginsenosidimutans]